MNPDIDIYNHIIQKQQVQIVQIKPISATTSLLLHLLFKGIVIVLFYMQHIVKQLTSQMVFAQLTIGFVIIDFWFTKNVNGRKLIGIRWSFDQDSYGNERFKIQARINQQYISFANQKLFWIVQFVYCTIPIVDISTIIIISPNLYRVQWDSVFVNVAIIIGGIANLFLFIKAKGVANQKVMQFKRQFNNQFIKKLGPNSLVTYL